MFQRERRMNSSSKVVKRDCLLNLSKRSSKSHEPMPDIPFDLVIDILTRLPAKSLMRFKSVSKQWSSLICSKDFTDHYQKVSPRLYMWLGFHNSHLKDVLVSSSHDSNVTTMSSFVVDQVMTIPSVNGYLIPQVYRGLICFTDGLSAQIYNVTTRQLVVLPDIQGSNIIPHDRVMYHIVHDPVHNQYKVVGTPTRRIDYEDDGSYLGRFASEHWVLLLGGDGPRRSQWRKIPTQCPPHRPFTEGLTLNGRMHYFAWVRMPVLVLVIFDINSEEFRILHLRNRHFFPRDADLLEYRGKVAILNHRELKDKGVMKLWVLEDGESNRWSTKKKLKLQSCQRHMVRSNDWKVQGTTKNGEVIFVPQLATCPPRVANINFKPAKNISHVLVYNLQTNDMRKVEIKEPSSGYLDRCSEVIGFDNIENLMHL